MEFINLKAAYLAHEDEFNQVFFRHCKDANFIGGDEIKRCELNLSEFANCPALSCSDGTNALIIALKAAGIQAGDEVITSAFTFIATAEAISIVGAKVVFADIADDYCLDIASVKAAISPKTKAILAVSLFGNTSNLLKLSQIAKEHNILLIEDAAQSFGARCDNDQPSCSVADISTTSFFPSKPLGCFGDGGAIFSHNQDFLKRAKLLANHGSQERYVHEIIGTNSRLDAIQAGILNVKLKYFKEELLRRNQLSARYLKELSPGFILPRVSGFSAWAQFSILVADKERFMNDLKAQNIPVAVHYPIPLHLQKAFNHLGYKLGDFPNAEFASKHICSLPFSAYLSDEEQSAVIKAANAALLNQTSTIHWPGKSALVLGCGVMGKNHIRELSKSGFNVDAMDVLVPDLSEFKHSSVNFTPTINPDKNYDLAIVATPTSQHVNAYKQLRAKTIIIEKPLALNSSEAKLIGDETFMGFNERFNQAFIKACSLIKDPLTQAKFVRASAKPLRIKDIDVAADLACHDLDLAKCLGFNLNELQLIHRCEDDFQAASDKLFIHSSWQSKEPIRAIWLSSQSRKIAVDLLNLVVYYKDAHEDSNQFKFGDEFYAHCEKVAAFSNLSAMHKAAINHKNCANYYDGLDVLKTLERLS